MSYLYYSYPCAYQHPYMCNDKNHAIQYLKRNIQVQSMNLPQLQSCEVGWDCKSLSGLGDSPAWAQPDDCNHIWEAESLVARYALLKPLNFRTLSPMVMLIKSCPCGFHPLIRRGTIQPHLPH